MEFDGPQMAYFESNGIRYEYKMIRFEGEDFLLLANALKHAIQLEIEGKPIVVWRQRPKIETIDADLVPTGKFRAWARVVAI